MSRTTQFEPEGGNSVVDWRILLTGGSTAGHVTAALAVVEALRACADSSGAQISFLYIGSKTGTERTLAEHAGLLFARFRQASCAPTQVCITFSTPSGSR